jgi:hypothetical protein
MNAPSAIIIALRTGRRFAQALVLLALLGAFLPSLTAQAPPPKLTVTPTPSTLIRAVTAVNDTVGARFRLSFVDPATNQEALQKGVKSQTYVITFGDTPKDGGLIDNVILKTTKGNVRLSPRTLTGGGFTLTVNSASQWTITGASGSLLPREIDIIGGFSNPGPKTVTLQASVTPLSSGQASTDQGKAIGTIVPQGSETLFLQDVRSGSVATDPVGTDPKMPLLVVAGPNRLGNIIFGMIGPDTAANVKYDWTIKRFSDPVRSGVFPQPSSATELAPYVKQLEDLGRATYTLTVTKTVGGKPVPFNRKIDFRILAVELNIQGVPPADKREPGAFIPLNGGNVNGSKATFGVPEKYDFEMNPLPKASLLVKATFVVGEEGSPPQGITGYRLSAANTGRARIRIWDTPTKQNEIVLPKQFGPNDLKAGSSIWLEGVREGAAEREITLTFEMLRGTQVLASDISLITVTPVLQQLAIVPTGGNTGADLTFDIQAGGLFLDCAAKDPKHVAMTLASLALRKNVPGDLKFVQWTRNNNNLDKGFGADLGGGDKRKWDFEGKNAGQWLLDSDKMSLPFYTAGEEPGKTKRPDAIRVLADDSPRLPVGPNRVLITSVLPDKGKTTQVDVTFEYTTFAVWRFPDGSIYFLGETTWNVRFAGALKPDEKSDLRYSFAPAPSNKNMGNDKVFGRSNDRHLDPKQPLAVKEPIANDAKAAWR